MAAIELKNVGHIYLGAEEHTLQHLDLNIKKGETHALLGGSGAGKTTLLNLLSGLLTPSEGKILFDGVDVTHLPAGERNVTQVFQFPVLYDSLNVLQNLEFPLRNRGWSKLDAKRRSVQVGEKLHLEKLFKSRTDKLSLYEKQMVAIARALVRPDVAVVLLDEPLTAVEPATKWQMRRALADIQRDLQVTMIYVTHDQTEALTFADRISVMYDGRLLQTDTPEKLHGAPEHEHVAHFIGSPGMNLVRGKIRDKLMTIGDQALGSSAHANGSCVFGFRPEWATLSTQSENGLTAKVLGVRVLGASNHQAFGLVSAELEGQQIYTRQAINVKAGEQAFLQLDEKRVLTFRAGKRLDA